MKAISKCHVLAISIALMSCEGIVGGSGYVYNNRNEPIDEVIVRIFHNDKYVRQTMTNEEGYFDGTEFVGCVPGCPDVKLEFNKRGFQTQTLDFKKYWEQNNQTPHLEDSLIIVLAKN